MLDRVLDRKLADAVLSREGIEGGCRGMSSAARFVLRSDLQDLFLGQRAIPILLSGHPYRGGVFPSLGKRLFDVVALGSQPEVIWAYAQGRITVVQDEQPIGDGSDEQDVGRAMRRDALTLQPETPITLGGVALPQPASLVRPIWCELQEAWSRIPQCSWAAWIHSGWHDGTLSQVTA